MLNTTDLNLSSFYTRHILRIFIIKMMRIFYDDKRDNRYFNIFREFELSIFNFYLVKLFDFIATM